MKKHLILFFLVALIGVASVDAQVVTGADIQNYSAKSIDSNPNMFIVPVVASIEVIKDAPSTFTTKGRIKLPANGSQGKPIMGDREYLDYINLTVKRSIEELKSKALFEFSERTGADVVLSPMYSITTDSSEGLHVDVTIKLKGYAARYTKFREMTADDSKLITTAAMVDKDMETRVLDSQSLQNTEKQTIVEE